LASAGQLFTRPFSGLLHVCAQVGYFLIRETPHWLSGFRLIHIGSSRKGSAEYSWLGSAFANSVGHALLFTVARLYAHPDDMLASPVTLVDVAAGLRLWVITYCIRHAGSFMDTWGFSG
jgi:hypothetical protein